jgi:hypothetical protein
LKLVVQEQAEGADKTEGQEQQRLAASAEQVAHWVLFIT